MTHIAALFVVLSQINGLPPGLLSAICYVESGHRPEAVHVDDGAHNSLGICQIQLPTSRFLGFKGSEAQLRKVEPNIRFAARYFSWELRRYHGDILKAVSAYNMGSWKLNKDGKTVNRAYVSKVLKAWQENR